CRRALPGRPPPLRCTAGAAARCGSGSGVRWSGRTRRPRRGGGGRRASARRRTAPPGPRGRRSRARSPRPPRRTAPRPEPREEVLEVVPRLLAAIEPLPAPADDARQLVAGVDRHDEALEAVAAAPAVDEERLDVRGQRLEDRVRLPELLPGFQRQ